MKKLGGEGDRIAKVIAHRGHCSRREAERLIDAGKVKLNGNIIDTPAIKVRHKDTIEIDGTKLQPPDATRLWLYHKPSQVMVTDKDPKQRRTLHEALAQHPLTADIDLPRLLYVGRLDYTTEGLLLLTNHGGLKRVLELPSTGWLRRYRVRAFGQTTQNRLDALKDGITIDQITYGSIEATLERVQGKNVWLNVGLREGKNREIKKVLAALGLQVNRLIRICYGPFQLGELKMGALTEVKRRVLRDQLGTQLTQQAGAHFDVEPKPKTRLKTKSTRPTGKPQNRADNSKRTSAKPKRTTHRTQRKPKTGFAAQSTTGSMPKGQR